MNSYPTHRLAAVARALGAGMAGLAMLAFAPGTCAATAGAPTETPSSGPAALPYGSGFERRQWALDGSSPAAPNTPTKPIEAQPNDGPQQGTAQRGGAGPSGSGRGQGRMR